MPRLEGLVNRKFVGMIAAAHENTSCSTKTLIADLAPRAPFRKPRAARRRCRPRRATRPALGGSPCNRGRGSSKRTYLPAGRTRVRAAKRVAAVGGEERLIVRFGAVAELRAAAGLPTEPRPQSRIIDREIDRQSESTLVTGRDQEPAHALLDELRDTADPRGDDTTPAGLGLEHDERTVFVPLRRDHHHTRRRHPRIELPRRH